jgi:pyrroline-5-carboxylate reductase
MRDEAKKVDANVGFLGAGGIASALAKGLCGSGRFAGKIFMYNPTASKVAALKNLYPEKIFAAASNQEVLDNSGVVIPAVLPGVLRQIAPSLKFRSELEVIHIATDIKLSEAASWYAPSRGVARAVPLPFASMRIGPLVLYGGGSLTREVFSLLGVIVDAPTEKDLEVMAAITGMMVSYHALAGETAKWGASKGAEFPGVLRYVTLMNEALSALMREECSGDVDAFLADNTTPRGMNELGLKMTREGGVYATWLEALGKIGARYGL